MSEQRVAVAVLHDDERPVPAVSRLHEADPVDEVSVAPLDDGAAVEERPDCVVAVPDGTIDPIERVDDRFPETPVIALAPSEDGIDAASALEAGATDVLRRDEDGREVLPRRVADIARRRRLERRFDAAFDDPTAAVCLLSTDGIVRRANEAARSAIEGSPVGSHFCELPWCERAARDGEAFRDAVRRAAAGESVHLETMLAGREMVDAEVVLRPVTGAEETTGVLAEFRGITKHDSAADRRPLMRTIVENLPLVLFAFDADGEFLLSQGKGLESLGLDPGEVVGESVFEVYADNERVVELCRRALDGERVEGVVEVRGTAFETWYHPVIEDGEVVRVIGAALDVTDLKERKHELARQNERLEEFASIVSHDLRNPLNVARGGVELLKDDPEAVDVTRIENALERMSTIVDDVLTLARAGERVESVEEVDLTRVARAAWRAVETRDAILSVESDATIMADPGRLQALFENLFANAVEHGGASVTVEVGPLDAGFYVADDGAGIPKADREAVFESGVTTAEGGTGFGLAIVRGIAEAHGWEISATEGEAGGARFEVEGVEFA